MKNIKDYLYHFQEKPPKGAWENIVNHIDNKPKFKFNYWKAATIALLLTNIGFGLKYLYDTRKTDLHTQVISADNQSKKIAKKEGHSIVNQSSAINNDVNHAENAITTTSSQNLVHVNSSESVSNTHVQNHDATEYIASKNSSATTYSQNKFSRKKASEKNKIQPKIIYVIQMVNEGGEVLSYDYQYNKPAMHRKNKGKKMFTGDDEDSQSVAYSDGNAIHADVNVTPDITQLQPFGFQFNKEIILQDISPLIFNIDESKENINPLKNYKKWAFQAFYAPGMMGSTSEEISYLPEINENKSVFGNTQNFGVKTSYYLTNKFFVRSGLEYLSFEQNTSKVTMSMPPKYETINKSFINYTGNMIHPSDIMAYSNANVISGYTPIGTIEGNINQRVAYTSIPLEVGYEFVKSKKFSANAILGGSAFFLTSNKITFQDALHTEDVGTANNLSDLSYSTQLGLEFNYLIYKNLFINLQPSFKYFINTFNTSSITKPILIGVNAGVSFRF